MCSYDEEFQKELLYFNNTMSLINKNLQAELGKRNLAQKELMDANRYMWENSVHFIDDIDRLSDIKQDISVIQVQKAGYDKVEKNISTLKNMRKKPYFARIDFKEDGESDSEKIYIGINNLLDEESYEPYIYDWRSPIASIFYRYELGKASYKAPKGEIEGEISLKRQYEIKNGKLDYFINTNVNVIDDSLKNALSKNTSSKMKSIVETIQREQDVVIRDIENDVLIVQGAAGSGKTSIALHRVAFLMYQGLISKLYANNILIISPNDLFGNYISDVLPELGEENIKTITFEYIFRELFGDRISVKSRNQLLEDIITTEDDKKRDIITSAVKFKSSKEFVIILQRLIRYFEHRMIEISDIYYNGIYIEDKNQIKEFLLRDTINMPIEKKLKTIRNRTFEKIQPVRKSRREKLERFISRYPHHQFEIKSLARLITIRESRRLKEQINNFTKIDYLRLYRTLFKNKSLFYNLAKGITLPENIEEIIECFSCESKRGIAYEDALALMYLKVKMSGTNIFKDIKQVVVDEAQDYYYIHFEIMKKLFNNSKFTILGDINQSIERNTSLSIYEDVKNILNKKRSRTVYLNKSFRCSYEISKFSNRFLNENIEIESFERHEELPKVIEAYDINDLDEKIVEYILEYNKLNYTSVAVLCKSMESAREVYSRLKGKIDIKIIGKSNMDINGVTIMPVYMSKGLEFDCVMVYGADSRNYNTKIDKNLLYIASTRALHKLAFFYTGTKSKYLEDD